MISSTTWPPRSARVLSVGTISRITDAVADAVLEWQRRPLGESSSRWSTTGAIRADGPRLFTGSPPARPISRSGRGMDGCQARGLSIWAPGRGRSLLEGRLVCAELANRGVKDVPIVEGAPPARERSARGNVTGSPAFPRRTQAVLGPRPRSPPVWSTRFRALDAVRVLRGLPEGRGRSQGRSAPPRARRPLGRL